MAELEEKNLDEVINEESLFQLTRLLHNVIDGEKGAVKKVLVASMFRDFGGNITSLYKELTGEEGPEVQVFLGDAKVLSFFSQEVLPLKPCREHYKVLARSAELLKAKEYDEAERLFSQLSAQCNQYVFRHAFKKELAARDCSFLRKVYYDLKTCTDFEALKLRYPKVSKKYLKVMVEENKQRLNQGLQDFMNVVYSQDSPEEKAQLLELLSALFLAASRFNADNPSWGKIRSKVVEARKKLKGD